jgi:hypothetical protein
MHKHEVFGPTLRRKLNCVIADAGNVSHSYQENKRIFKPKYGFVITSHWNTECSLKKNFMNFLLESFSGAFHRKTDFHVSSTRILRL